MRNTLSKYLILYLFSVSWGVLSQGGDCPKEILFSQSPLVRSLEAIFQREYEQGRVRNLPLDLLWVFRTADALELLDEAGRNGFAEGGLQAFITEVENACLRAGRALSKCWTGPADRRGRFMKNLALRFAYEYQVSQSSQNEPQEPPVLLRDPGAQSEGFTLNAAEVESIFGSIEEFQAQYRKYARSRMGTRVPHRRPATQTEVTKLNQKLRGLGLSPLKSGHPVHAMDVREANREEQLKIALSVLRTHSGEKNILGFLSNDRKLEPQRLQNGFGSLNAFLRELMIQSKAEGIDIPIGEGFRESPVLEWLVQTQAFYLSDLGFGPAGFQTEDPDENLYLDPVHPMLQEARLASRYTGPAFFQRLTYLVRKAL